MSIGLAFATCFCGYHLYDAVSRSCHSVLHGGRRRGRPYLVLRLLYYSYEYGTRLWDIYGLSCFDVFAVLNYKLLLVRYLLLSTTTTTVVRVEALLLYRYTTYTYCTPVVLKTRMIAQQTVESTR